jgi:GAF domain-containing protein
MSCEGKLDVRLENEWFPSFANPFPEALPTCSELCTPIRARDETTGVLDIQSAKLNSFDTYDVLLIETFAAQIALAFENARMYEKVTGKTL